MLALAMLPALVYPSMAQNHAGPDLAGFTRDEIQTEEGVVSFLFRERKGPALILIPGSFTDSRQWEPLLAWLDADLTLVLVELRGHGKSWPPPASGSIEQFASDVLRIANRRKLRRFYAGGHSIGGMIALEMGRRWPKRIRGILSIEGWTNYHAMYDAFGGAKSPPVASGSQGKYEAERKRATGGWTDAQRKVFGKIWRSWDGSEFLRTTTLPILEVYGDRGRPRPALDLLRIPNRVNIEVQWIAGATHIVPFEKPRELADAMTDFIRRTQTRRR
jgi:pimeloyl-ACP methyl ester carboxylesterase